MQINFTTPALLFPAISLLLLAYRARLPSAPGLVAGTLSSEA